MTLKDMTPNGNITISTLIKKGISLEVIPRLRRKLNISPLNSNGSSIKKQQMVHSLRRSLAETFDAPPSGGYKPYFESRSGWL
jgi:hypothetical protein